jgi:hypothetical protein
MQEGFFALVGFIGFFACVFGIYYLHTRQNLAMIEKGLNPRIRYNRPAPFKILKWSLLLVGAGAGLFLAYILDEYVLKQYESYIENGLTHYYRRDGNPAIYFSLIAIGGGLGLFGSYRMEKKWWDENKEIAQA